MDLGSSNIEHNYIRSIERELIHWTNVDPKIECLYTELPILILSQFSYQPTSLDKTFLQNFLS